MVYKLVSTSMDTLISEDLEQPIRGHTEGMRCYNSLQNVINHSSLFRVCKQTRSEGLALFYHHHQIQLSVEHSGCYLAILLWLRRIGSIGRNNIRLLQINYKAKVYIGDIQYMGWIDRLLSNQATVVYVADKGQVLWRIGHAFWLRNAARAPLFGICGMNGGAGPVHETFQDYRLAPRWPSYTGYDWVKFSLTF